MTALPFQGLVLHDLQPCSYIEEKQKANGNICSKVVVDKSKFPFRVGSIVFDGGSLLGLGEPSIRAVGLVLEGQRKTTTVMLLEVKDGDHTYKNYKEGQTAHFQDYCTWTMSAHNYVVTAQQRAMLEAKLNEWKIKKAEKRKREKDERVAKKNKFI